MYGWKDLKTVSAIKNCKEKVREVKKPKHRKCKSQWEFVIIHPFSTRQCFILIISASKGFTPRLVTSNEINLNWKIFMLNIKHLSFTMANLFAFCMQRKSNQLLYGGTKGFDCTNLSSFKFMQIQYLLFYYNVKGMTNHFLII